MYKLKHVKINYFRDVKLDYKLVASLLILLNTLMIKFQSETSTKDYHQLLAELMAYLDLQMEDGGTTKK